MNFECPICKKVLKKVPIILLKGRSTNLSYIRGLAWECCEHSKKIPGHKKKFIDKHCRYDLLPKNEIVKLHINVFPYRFTLDYLEKTTEICLFTEPYKPIQSGGWALSAQEHQYGGWIYTSITTIHSILDLPWSHPAQVIDKARLYTLFS